MQEDEERSWFSYPEKSLSIQDSCPYTNHKKQDVMKIMKVAALSAVLAAQFALAQFKQNPLPYAYNALEGNIDAQTMEIHYSKHAAAYVANLNKAIAGTPQEKQTLDRSYS